VREQTPGDGVRWCRTSQRRRLAANLRSFPAVQWTSMGAGGAESEARCSKMVRNGE